MGGDLTGLDGPLSERSRREADGGQKSDKSKERTQAEHVRTLRVCSHLGEGRFDGRPELGLARFMAHDYRLVYWPGLPGRGEFVRVVFEDLGLAFQDTARRSEAEGGGFPAVRAFVEGRNPGDPHYAPPIVSDGEIVVSQTPAVLAWLGARHGLWPESESGRTRALQLQLTLADFVTEIHDTHHPLLHAGYYEDQKDAAIVRSEQFLQARMPRFLGHFEDVLDTAGGVHMVRDGFSTVDLAMFHLLEGLEYAFPRSFARQSPGYPLLSELRERVRARPRLSAYLASDRRMPFNERGVFRRYPELDEAV